RPTELDRPHPGGIRLDGGSAAGVEIGGYHVSLVTKATSDASGNRRDPAPHVRPRELRGCRAKSPAPPVDGPQPLSETCPRPRLELGIARLVLPTRCFEVLEPGVRLLDLQQLLSELSLGHLAPPGSIG